MTAQLTAPRPGSPLADGLVWRTAGPGRIVVLLLAAFLPPWSVWGSRIAQAHGLIGWHLPQGLALWSMLPTVLAATALVSGRAGLRDLLRRLSMWRVPARLYLLAVLGPVAIAAGSVGLVAAFGGQVHLGQTLGLRAALAYFGYGVGLYLLTEETAWRGLVLPRLQARLSPLAASVALGLVWGAWHLPLLAVPGEGDQGLPVGGFLLLIMATTVLISTVVNAAGGSVVVAAVFHAAFNASYSFAGVVGAEHTVFWTAVVLSMLCAVAVAVWTRGRLGLPG